MPAPRSIRSSISTAGAERQRIDPATFGFPDAPNPGPFNVFSLGVNASYNFDIFGGTRRELEALAAEVDYQAYELEAARLTLASNVVATALRQSALRAQIELTERILACAARTSSAITEERYRLGGVALARGAEPASARRADRGRAARAARAMSPRRAISSRC